MGGGKSRIKIALKGESDLGLAYYHYNRRHNDIGGSSRKERYFSEVFDLGWWHFVGYNHGPRLTTGLETHGSIDTAPC